MRLKRNPLFSGLDILLIRNMRMKVFFFISLFIAGVLAAHGQDAPNLANLTSLAGNTQEQNKLGSVPVNIYTGMPNVSVPIYSYGNSGSGLSWNVSLDYFTGGMQLGEPSSTVGMGWFFNATGAITRTVRGMPDDVPTNGYLYSSAIPTDFRSNGNKYYFDSIDAEQDIFQFSFNGNSGKFVIGKNKQIVLIPNSKLKITYSVSTFDNSTITGFRVVTQDGVKYDFTTQEVTNVSPNLSFNFGYTSAQYVSAWYLSDIISAFNTDTIKFNYVSLTSSTGTIGYPNVTYVRNSDGVRTATYKPKGTFGLTSYKLSSIVFPDKKNLNVVYSYSTKYNQDDYCVSKIKITDSVFRYGYALSYTSAVTQPGALPNIYLSAVTPYTAKQMQKGYQFTYNPLKYTPYADSDFCKKDYWGFYNGATNGQTLIPAEGSIGGANRNPNINYAVANSLSYFYLPGGGYIYYEYELNDHYPYNKSVNTLTVPGNTTALQSNSVAFNQVFGTKQQLVFTLDPSVSRTGSAPISGTGTITCTVKSTDGATTYSSNTFSLFDLFYLGMKVWQFNVPANGSYLLQTQVASGTTVTGSLPIIVSWENKTIDNSHTAILSGGLRVKRITRREAPDDPNVTTEDYRYVTADGKSSGILGDTAAYSYQYKETVVNGSTTTTAYTVISSDPVTTMNYSQGSPVGYSRVVVYKGASNHNLGYTVYDFTGLAETNRVFPTYTFPYTPQDIREWGLGLPKRVSVYDSSNNIVRRTVNTIQLDTVTYNTSNFLSLKLGVTSVLYNGDPTLAATPRTRTFIGQQYYPSTGRIYVSASTDTLYQADGSINTTFVNYLYDTNFNVKKITKNYDRNRGLQTETNIYYPYNYIVGGAVGKLRDSGIIAGAIASETWITGDGNTRLISGSITDYQQLTPSYIKPATYYELKTNAPIPLTTIGAFDSSKLNRNATYFVAQTSFPKYDSKGNLLQTTNLVSGQSNSAVRDYNNQYTIATVSNAAFSDVAYTSFESDGTGNWTIPVTTRDTSGGITGKLAYNLSNGNITKSGLNSATSYIVSVWAKTGASVSINGTSQTSFIAQQNGWNLYFTTLSSGITTVTISGTGVIDELRLYPKDANMASTTYEPNVGATSVCDANSNIAYTEYDYLNRPKIIRDRDKNIIKRYDYSDHDSLITTAPIVSGGSNSVTLPVSSTSCTWDSTYTATDINPWSDTYQKILVNTTVTVPSYCSCTYSSNYPQYKIVSGACEQGVKQYSSCVYKAGAYQCKYHYVWSDCSVSVDYSETDDTPQTVTTGCGVAGM